jgi:hypothetical protein
MYVFGAKKMHLSKNAVHCINRIFAINIPSLRQPHPILLHNKITQGTPENSEKGVALKGQSPPIWKPFRKRNFPLVEVFTIGGKYVDNLSGILYRHADKDINPAHGVHVDFEKIGSPVLDPIFILFFKCGRILFY